RTSRMGTLRLIKYRKAIFLLIPKRASTETTTAQTERPETGIAKNMSTEVTRTAGADSCTPFSFFASFIDASSSSTALIKKQMPSEIRFPSYEYESRRE